MDEKIKIFGVEDSSISEALKIWVKQGNVMVVGLIGPGTSRTLTAKWNNPLMQSNLGNVPGATNAAALLQLETGNTSISTLNTTQTWEGNESTTFNLNMIFIAQSNANKEVMQALQALEEFASPEVNALAPGGRIPQPVSICIGTKIALIDCVIESISMPLDKERDKDGNLIRAEVTLNVTTKKMKNQSEVASTWSSSQIAFNK